MYSVLLDSSFLNPLKLNISVKKKKLKNKAYEKLTLLTIILFLCRYGTRTKIYTIR